MLKITEGINSIAQATVEDHNVNRINSIAGQYKEKRQESKAPTFLNAVRGYIPYPND